MMQSLAYVVVFSFFVFAVYYNSVPLAQEA